MKTSDNSCRICSSNRIELFYDFSLCGIESWQRVRYLRCKECGIVYNENIDDADICRMYSGDIYAKYGVSRYGVESDEYANTIAKDLEREMNIIERYVDKGRILDIGCARGYFLYFMYQNGWDVYGNDLSEHEIGMGRSRFGLKLFVGDLCQLQFPDGYFDVITMWDVIEHLQDPLRCLVEANRILRKGGLIAIKTPNKNTLFWRIPRFLYSATKGTIARLRCVRPLYPGAYWHLYYFSPGSIETLLQRTGFNIVDIATQEAYFTRHLLAKSRLPKRVVFKSLLSIDRLLGTQAKLSVYAGKSNTNNS